MASALSLERETQIACLNPTFFVNGENLEEGEKRIIDPRDTWKIALIDGLTFEEQVQIGNCFVPLDFKHYTQVQVRDWLEKEQYLVGTQVGAHPSDSQVLDNIISCHTGQRYRLCYTLNHPTLTRLCLSHPSLNEAEVFLGLAEKEDPNHFPYFSALMANSLQLLNN
jgi:hypothetical protein